VTASAGSFTTREVAGIDARAAVLGPSFYGEIGLEVIRVLARPDSILAVYVQGYLRRVTDGRLSYSSWEERREVLPLVTILKTDAIESQFLTGESDIHRAARILHGEGIAAAPPRSLISIFPIVSSNTAPTGWKPCA
jgi:hypothetical protein